MSTSITVSPDDQISVTLSDGVSVATVLSIVSADVSSAISVHNSTATSHGLTANISAALTAAANPSVNNAMATLNQSIRLRDFVICAGDSITNSYTSYLAALLSSSVWNVLDAGVAGNTTTQISARFSHVVPAGTAYVSIMGGVNDVLSGISAATIESNLQAMYTAAAALGAKVVAATITPCKAHASWTSDKQVVLDAVNAWILNTATGVDYRVNTYDALENTPGDDLLKVAYDSGDGLHPNTAGLTALASTIHAGATWTPPSSIAFISAGSTPIYLNQNLRTTDDVCFDSLYSGLVSTPNLIATFIHPIADAVGGIKFFNAAITGNPRLNIDTVNNRVGINNGAPSYDLDVTGNAKVGQQSGPSIMYVTSASGFSSSLIVGQVGYESWYFQVPANSTNFAIFSGSKANVITMNSLSGAVAVIDDLSITTADKGPIIRDRSDGHTYRIKVTSGVLGVEVVT